MATDRLPNHSQFERLIAAVASLKDGNSGGGQEVIDIDTLVNSVRLGVAPTIYPVGTEITVSGVTQEISTSQGNVNGASSAGVTGVTVNNATYMAKTGGQTGTNSFYYDGSSWRLGSPTGQWVNLADYGITVQGTPASGDYVTVTVPTSSIVFRVAGYDHYEPVNPNVQHTVALECKDIVKMNQQYNSDDSIAFMAVTKKAMPAGKYKFTAYMACGPYTDEGYKHNTDGAYVFTTTKEIPVGGALFSSIGLCEHNPSVDTIVGAPVATLGADRDRANKLEEVTISRYSSSTDTDAVDLGTFAGPFADVASAPYENRQNEYGVFSVLSKNYTYGEYGSSLLRQWLTADKPADGWFADFLNVFQVMPSSEWPKQRDGFVYTLPAGLKKYLCKVKVKTTIANGMVKMMQALSLDKPAEWTSKVGGTIEDVNDNLYVSVVEDAVFLPSITEVGITGWQSENFDPRNTVLPLYEGSSDADRVKEFDDEAKVYWLRGQDTGGNNEPYWRVSYAGSIDVTGALQYSEPIHNATDTLGVAPIIVLG